MSDKPDSIEPQLPAGAAEPESTPAAEAGDTPGPGTPAAASDLSAGQQADVTVAPEEVQATMQELLTAAEASAADAPAEGGGAMAVSPEEVEAAMKEIAAASGPDVGEEAAAAGTGPAESAPGAAATGAEPGDTPVAEEETLAAEEPPPLPPGAAPFQPPEFAATPSVPDASKIELLDDVELEVKIELGRTEMFIEDVLGLTAGSVVELDKAAGDPVDIFVNERLVARGEVLVLNDNFCVRINDILSPIPELEKEK